MHTSRTPMPYLSELGLDLGVLQADLATVSIAQLLNSALIDTYIQYKGIIVYT